MTSACSLLPPSAAWDDTPVPPRYSRIHVGCGKRDFGEGWIHIDGEKFSHVKKHDVFLNDFPDGFADLIYSSHLIAYFDREEVKELLKAWHRVLKPGGTLRLAVPDFEAMADLYVAGEYPLENFLGPLYGKMKMGQHSIYHKTVYDWYSLFNLLKEIGFSNITPYNWRGTEHANIDDHSQAYLPHMDKDNGTLISLNVECTK